MTEPPAGLEPLLARLASLRTDEEAWRALYRQTWPFVFAVVYRRLRGVRALAEDASQEVFIRLARACPFEQLRDPDAFRRYVWRVADNVARTYARRVMGRYAAEVPASETDVALVEAHRPDRAEEEVDARELLRRVVDYLDPGDREIVRLVIEGRSLSEIGKATGLSHNNVGVRLHRLRQRLRKSLFSKESSPS